MKQIKIGVVTWTIKEVQDLRMSEYIFGDCNINNQVIRLDATISQEHKEQVLMHELLHACLYTMCEEELNGNEKFVNMLAHLLTQINQQLKE